MASSRKHTPQNIVRKSLQPPIICIRCRRTFLTRHLFNKHCAACLKSRRINQVECEYCGKWLPWRVGKLYEALQKHYPECKYYAQFQRVVLHPKSKARIVKPEKFPVVMLESLDDERKHIRCRMCNCRKLMTDSDYNWHIKVCPGLKAFEPVKGGAK